MTKEENRDRVRRQRAKKYRDEGRRYVKGTGNGRRYSKPIVVTDEDLDRRAAVMLEREARSWSA